MARNAGGTHSLPSPGLAVSGQTASSTANNNVFNDLSAEITDSLCRSGKGAMLANLPMGGFKATNMAVGTAATDAATLGQAQSGVSRLATVVGGTAQAIALTFSPVFTAYTAGMQIAWLASGANTAADPTVAVDGMATKTVKKLNGTSLVAGDIAGSAHLCFAIYNGTDFILINPKHPTTATRPIIIAASDEVSALTTGTGKATFRMPYAYTLTGVRASLKTAQTSGSIFTVDINEGGTTVLSTKLTVDNGEKTSTTAATAAVISDAAIADDAEITIDIDQVGDGTAIGLKVTLLGYPSA